MRPVHVVLSLFALALLLFFGATGFLMNHGDWFGVNEARTGTVRGLIAPALLERPGGEEIARELRARFGVAGRLEDFEVDDREIHAVFRGPGRIVDAFIDRREGEVTIKTETGNLAAALADLHRGKRTGWWGGRAVDGAAAALALAALSGLVLWLSQSSCRRSGLAALAAGIALGALAAALCFA